MKREYKHYSQATNWQWPYFSARELACKGTGRLMIDADALSKLHDLRERLGIPMIITSAYRSPSHNRAVGGASRSKHMEAIAFDVRMDNHDPHDFEAAARAVGFTGFGYYPKQGFMHIDTSTPRSWGSPFSKTVTRLPIEPVAPKPNPLTAIIAAILRMFKNSR